LRFFQRRPQEADAAFRSALVRLEHRLAANPGDERALGVSATISNLRAQTLWYLDRVPEAIAHAEQALAMNARLYGAESRQVAIVLTNLAGFQHNAGRLGDAERSYRRSLALHEKLFGPSDARLRFVASGLADVLFKLGRLDDSYRLYEQALAAGRKGLGPTHTGVGVDLLNLGRVRLAQGRFAEAEARLAESEALAETTSTRSYVAVVHAARGEILAMQGRPAEAAARYRQARRVLAENQRAGSRQDVMLAVELARLRGEPAAAASELAALVETVRSQAPSSAEMVTALQALGETLVDAGRVEEGIAKLREAVALGEGDVGSPADRPRRPRPRARPRPARRPGRRVARAPAGRRAPARGARPRLVAGGGAGAPAARRAVLRALAGRIRRRRYGSTSLQPPVLPLSKPS
jgi:ATP/maltotriose-dependent transcriptional regulator MalT